MFGSFRYTIAKEGIRKKNITKVLENSVNQTLGVKGTEGQNKFHGPDNGQKFFMTDGTSYQVPNNCNSAISEDNYLAQSNSYNHLMLWADQTNPVIAANDNKITEEIVGRQNDLWGVNGDKKLLDRNTIIRFI
jgi:hypothetical protein